MSPNLNLRSLDLSWNSIGNAGVRALLRSAWFERLTGLSFQGNNLDRARRELKRHFGDRLA
jgi:hypothetical protein